MGLSKKRYLSVKNVYTLKEGRILRNGDALTEGFIVYELNLLESILREVENEYNELMAVAEYFEDKLKENKVTF